MKTEVDLILGAWGQDGLMIQKVLGRRLSNQMVLVVKDGSGPRECQSGCQKVYYGDLSNSDFLIKVLREVQPDRIFFFAGISRDDDSVDFLTHKKNYLTPAMTLLEWGASSSVKICIASSVLVFGQKPEGRITVNSTLKPQSYYSEVRATLLKEVNTINSPNVLLPIFSNHESVYRSTHHFFGRLLDSVSNKTVYRNDGSLVEQRDWGHAGEYMFYLSRLMDEGISGPVIFSTAKTLTCAHVIWSFFKNCPKFFPDHHLLRKVEDVILNNRNVPQFVYDNSGLVNLIGHEPKYYGDSLVRCLIKDLKLV